MSRWLLQPVVRLEAFACDASSQSNVVGDTSLHFNGAPFAITLQSRSARPSIHHFHEPSMSPQTNCCQRSSLRRLGTVGESRSGRIVLALCDSCRTYWLVSVLKHVMVGTPVECKVEDIERISDEEGSDLLLSFAR